MSKIKIELPPCTGCWDEEIQQGGVDCNSYELYTGGCKNYCPVNRERNGNDYPTGFDAVAAAVIGAGLFYEQTGPHPNKDPEKYQAKIFTHPRLRGWRETIGTGPNPTPALVAACVKYNEEAECESGEDRSL